MCVCVYMCVWCVYMCVCGVCVCVCVFVRTHVMDSTYMSWGRGFCITTTAMLASVRPLRTDTLLELSVYVTGLSLHKMAACIGVGGELRPSKINIVRVNRTTILGDTNTYSDFR